MDQLQRGWDHSIRMLTVMAVDWWCAVYVCMFHTYRLMCRVCLQCVHVYGSGSRSSKMVWCGLSQMNTLGIPPQHTFLAIHEHMTAGSQHWILTAYWCFCYLLTFCLSHGFYGYLSDTLLALHEHITAGSQPAIVLLWLGGREWYHRHTTMYIWRL